MSYTSETVDLAARRAERARARAARREGRGETLRIQYGEVFIAELAAEFPLDVLEPLQDLNVDLPLLISQALQLFSKTSDDTVSNEAALEFIVGVLATNPDLPKEIVSMVQEMARRLFGEDGYATFVATRPTPWDVADLATLLFSWYGVGLGESSPSTTPSPAGATSNTTSAPTSASTPAGRGDGLEKKAS
ncbi:hypothetical protein AB0395_21730 [Streptosporangium sp. NPDC051023]|uniref:hypothetical protein n=1 Tax=Streptosporangium sp. NPDC051023 TaxID=3155410 RepID=UPI00344F53B5